MTTVREATQRRPGQRTGRRSASRAARHSAGRSDWRDTLTVASDLAVVGIAVTVASLPLLSAAASVRTGSVAVRAIVFDHRTVTVGELWRVWRRSLLPGLCGSVLAGVAAALIVLDLGAVGGGRVPGGYPMLAVLGVAAAILIAVCGLTVVRLGRDPDGSWRAALRWALRTARRQPIAAAAVAGVLTVAAAIGVMIPLTAPIVAGYALFALHVVTTRLTSTPR